MIHSEKLQCNLSFKFSFLSGKFTYLNFQNFVFLYLILDFVCVWGVELRVSHLQSRCAIA
jgi:hypothetical protein